MSRYILLLFVLISLLPKTSSGQIAIDTIGILKETIRSKSDTSIFYYTEKVDTFFLNKIKLAITKNKLCGSELIRFNTFKKRCIKLTPQEHSYIISEVHKHIQTYWIENLFTDSKLISLETLYKLKDGASKLPIEEVSHNRPMFQVHQFTNPIFIKNGKYFILQKITFWVRDKSFQIASISDYLSVYKKENGVWKRYLIVDGGTLDF